MVILVPKSSTGSSGSLTHESKRTPANSDEGNSKVSNNRLKMYLYLFYLQKYMGAISSLYGTKSEEQVRREHEKRDQYARDLGIWLFFYIVIPRMFYSFIYCSNANGGSKEEER